METKALKYMLAGLLVDVALVLAGLAVVSATAAGNYDGVCGRGLILGGAGHPCSRAEYVYESVTLFGLLLLVFGWWWLLPLLSLPPAAGLLIGRKRPAGPPPR